ncbi:amidophosphoribosyltransferase [Bartonella sp. TP]|uniref:amidophosphoribosyltransferase n=1 Tax=Bartonella sp. TP TaxID=3057550 RepID=UPI0025B09332|nr:amidophosphoribosyltransferase [Bartonella sp. TP]WJW80132.1 amidophosphoribosyltransferase [Bartonella sp. TP]
MHHDFLPIDKLQEECGVFAILGHEHAAYLTMLGLHALQHRGQDSVGIISYEKTRIYQKKALGTVLSNFNAGEALSKLPGESAIGHVRYSTLGDTELENIQPLLVNSPIAQNLSLAHNGQLLISTSAKSNTSDSHGLIKLIKLNSLAKNATIESAFTNTINAINGGFAIVALNENILFAARDPIGIRPLIMGMLDGSPIFCSESCALDIIGAEFVREVENGEIICCKKLTNGSVEIIQLQKPCTKPAKLCIFEYIYFSHNDSEIKGQNIYNIRKHMGKILATEAYIQADIVVPIQHSGTASALGYACQSRIPFELAISASSYAGRSFIAADITEQTWAAKIKHNVNKQLIAGKNIILVDDSIVRGTTLKAIIKQLKAASAASIHIRIASPMLLYPDYFGINIKTKTELLSYNYTDAAAMAKHLGVDSIAFLSLDGVYKAICNEKRNDNNPQLTDHYFTGQYPDFYNNSLF